MQLSRKFLGSEKPLFVKHTAMMREACKELPQSVEYVPLACEAHSHRSVALAKTVAAPIMATGVGSALMYATSSGPYYAQSLSGSPDIEMIKIAWLNCLPSWMLLCATNIARLLINGMSW